MAKVHLRKAKVLALHPMGYKDHSLKGNGLDASDVDEKVGGRYTTRPIVG